MRTFIKKFGADTVFDPEAVTILVGAFDDAWRSVEASGAPLATDKHAPMARELLAKHIIEAAKQGERDQRQLSQEALLQLTRSNPEYLSK